MQDIYVGDVGKGFPLVLVHSFLGSSIIWEPQINYLKKNYRVITPDIPGFGNSSKAQLKNNINEVAKIIIDCLKEKKIGNFFLLGHSMGGMIAQEMTKLVGEKINKLVCYGTGLIGNISCRFETINESRNRLKKEGLKNTAYRIAKTWFLEDDKSKYFNLCEEAGKTTTLEAADNVLIAMKNWNGVENLKNIKNSTLIIWGDKDKAYNFNQIDALKKNISNNEILIFKGCSHNVHLEKRDEFNKCIDKFLNKFCF